HRRMKAHGLGPDGQGVPTFKAGDSHFVTQPPLRWEYPQSEIFNNELNVKEALDRQFGGENDIDGLMWMIKDRKSTRLNSSHVKISYAVFCLKKKNEKAI